MFKHFNQMQRATKLFEMLPAFRCISRRNQDKVKMAIVGSARFHHKDRMTFTSNVPIDASDMSKGNYIGVFCTPEDYYNAITIYGKNAIDESLECNNRQRLIMKVIKQSGRELYVKEICNAMRNLGQDARESIIKADLKSLINTGYVDSEKKGLRNEEAYSVTNVYKEAETIPEYGEIVLCAMESVRREFPEYAEEYISRYCGSHGKLYVTDPFTGERVNLFETVNAITKDRDIEQNGTFVSYINRVNQDFDASNDTFETIDNAVYDSDNTALKQTRSSDLSQFGL